MLDDQLWLTQQPISGASFSRGSAAASRRISGVTFAGRTLRARAISLAYRPRARAELADTFQQFVIVHSTMIPDAGTPARVALVGALPRELDARPAIKI